MWEHLTWPHTPEHKRSDRAFQFHGKQCGSCDKADDTTRTTALWRKLHAAIFEALRFCNGSEERKSVKNKTKKRKFNAENPNYTQKSQTFDIGPFDAIWIVSKFYNYFSAIKTSLFVKGKSEILSVTLANYSNPDNQDALWVSVLNKIWVSWCYLLKTE